MSDVLLYELGNGIATLTLNRPEKRNALSPELIAALAAALRRADSDPQVRVVLLTGSGDKAFCAGADLRQMSGGSVLAMHEARAHLAELLGLFSHIGKVVVGAANGHALAGGFGLLMACDFVIARRDARYGTPEIKRGLFPMMIISILQRVLGRRRTLELVLGGQDIDGESLVAWGGANEVVEAAAVRSRAQALCEHLASLSPAILGLGKRSYYAAEDMAFSEQLEFLRSQLTVNSLTEDAAEGINSFFDKRAPVWTGR